MSQKWHLVFPDEYSRTRIVDSTISVVGLPFIHPTFHSSRCTVEPITVTMGHSDLERVSSNFSMNTRTRVHGHLSYTKEISWRTFQYFSPALLASSETVINRSQTPLVGYFNVPLEPDFIRFLRPLALGFQV